MRCPVRSYMESLDSDTRERVEQAALTNHRFAADIRENALADGNNRRAESTLWVAVEAYVQPRLKAWSKRG